MVITWRPWTLFEHGTTKTALALLLAGTEPFRQAHRGVEIRISTVPYQQATVASLLAGSGPDIFEDWVLPPYVQTGLLLNLDSYVQQANVDLGRFFPGQLDTMYWQQPDGTRNLYALPAYLHSDVQAVNLGVLDELGLAQPEPGWTYAQWAQLWGATAIASANAPQRRAGASLIMAGYMGTGGNPRPFYWHAFGGEFVNPADTTRCYLSSSGSIAFGEWFSPLIQAGVIGNGNFAQGTVVTYPFGSGQGILSGATAWRAVKWDVFPQPVGPKGQYAQASGDFYAIWAEARRPDVCWEFLQFLTVQPDWQRFMIKTALAGPNQGALWSDWATLVQGYAPPLAGKNLQVLVQAVQGGQAYYGSLLRYDNTQAASIMNTYTHEAWTGRRSVAEAFRLATEQVDALESIAPGQSASASRAQARFPSAGPPVAKVPLGL